MKLKLVLAGLFSYITAIFLVFGTTPFIRMAENTFPIWFTFAVITTGFIYSILLAFFAGMSTSITATKEYREKETAEFHRAWDDPAARIPPGHSSAEQAYPQGKVFELSRYGRYYEAYVLSDKEVLFTDKESGSVTVIPLNELRRYRAEENTRERRERLRGW